MGRLYSASFNNVAVTAAQDFFEVAPGDDNPVAIHGLFLSQSTETGDSEEEMLRIEVVRGNATTGSGGSTLTGRQLNPQDADDAATVKANNTTEASAGTEHQLHVATFNVRVGFELWLPPECRWMVSQAETMICVRLLAAPADSVSMSGTIYYEEIM